MTEITIIDIFIRLGLAALLGMTMGIERILAHKTAGMRTYALVSMGASLFVIVSSLLVNQFYMISGFNPAIMASSIISGVGFLCAGIIFHRDDKLIGITSAAALWVCAGVGMSVGYGYFELGIIATVFVLFIFVVLWFIEQQIKKFPNPEDLS